MTDGDWSALDKLLPLVEGQLHWLDLRLSEPQREDHTGRLRVKATGSFPWCTAKALLRRELNQHLNDHTQT